jgi:alkyl hydroperoxide reductase subunit AhpC
MIELGELEKRHEAFEKKNVRLVVVSNDDEETSTDTQKKFPHLVVISDEKQDMAKAMQVIHAGQDPKGGDTNAPTTFLVDGTGTVRWLFRPSHYIERLAPEGLLKAVDDTF